MPWGGPSARSVTKGARRLAHGAARQPRRGSCPAPPLPPPRRRPGPTRPLSAPFLHGCRAEEVRGKFERYGPIRDVYLPKDYCEPAALPLCCLFCCPQWRHALLRPRPTKQQQLPGVALRPCACLLPGNAHWPGAAGAAASLPAHPHACLWQCQTEASGEPEHAQSTPKSPCPRKSPQGACGNRHGQAGSRIAHLRQQQRLKRPRVPRPFPKLHRFKGSSSPKAGPGPKNMLKPGPGPQCKCKAGPVLRASASLAQPSEQARPSHFTSVAKRCQSASASA